ncbi:MAG: hypothetical protein KJP23_03255, partial [Deltaproteobacteria bacterium]|nr:hypothetical protein [Deltaproteobacteria bacterium]
SSTFFIRFRFAAIFISFETFEFSYLFRISYFEFRISGLSGLGELAADLIGEPVSAMVIESALDSWMQV